ncbi:hypothetical protein [Rubrolithibacter danxiaensis]|uniref:hypothetical protein n=1 Tax=Rubrolithibacter danxiaensis TaxID=3390805 RepID=UPI003BF7BC22
MKSERRPVLLTVYNLVAPIEQALARLEEIRQHKSEIEEKILLEGLFVLAVSTFEIALIDTLKFLLSHVPQKLDTKAESISKEDLIEGNALDRAIEIRLQQVSYKGLKEIIDYFVKITSIQNQNIFKHFEHLQEIKATRNLLIHNNLIVNRVYEETAGPLQREQDCFRRLYIDQHYLFYSILNLRETLEEIKNSLIDKYKTYTYINALKNLWSFIFTSPVMVFENEWIIDLEKDIVIERNETLSKRECLSSSEQMMYDIWYAHLYGSGLNFDQFNFYKLAGSNRDKAAYLLTIVDIFKDSKNRMRGVIINH